MGDGKTDHDGHARATTHTTGAKGPILKHEVIFPNSPEVLPSLPPEVPVHSSHQQPPVTIFQLSWGQRILAGSGHVLNDLCSSLWFTYLLLYMTKVVKFSDGYSAGLLLWGQLVDGFATPLVGYTVDHVESLWFCKKSYGRCKSWHFLGMVLVMLTFPFVFSPCVGYSYHTSEWAQVPDWEKAMYYAPFIGIFQIGWGCTQVAHLALIPKLTPDDLIRTEILAIRYAFTVAANVSVFLMTWFFLSNPRTPKHNEECAVDTNDAASFSFLAFLSIGFGGLFSILFHVFVVENSDQVVKTSATMLAKMQEATDTMEHPNAIPNNGPNKEGEGDTSPAMEDGNKSPTNLQEQDEVETGNEDDIGRGETSKTDKIRVSANSLQLVKAYSTKSLNTGKEIMGVRDWMRLPQFYMVACVFWTTKLVVNLSQTYIPFYVEVSLGLNCSFVAVIPLTMFCSGFGITLVIKLLNKYLGRQIAYGIGTALVIIGASLILTLDWSTSAGGWAIYVIAVLLGGGASAILVTSLAVTADLIGNNVESGAFVYGAMSFCEKLSSGFAVVLINSLIPCGSERTDCDNANATHTDNPNAKFYADALGYSTGGSSLAGLTFIILLTFLIIKKTSKPPTPSSSATPAVEAAS